jgi:hypothetical protein
MSRKRSLSSILNEESDRPYAIPSSRRNRSISTILDEESSNQSSSTPSRSGRLVVCNYHKCNGRLVDPRTKFLHESNQNSEDDSSEGSEVQLSDTTGVSEAELPRDDQSTLDAELPRDEYEGASADQGEAEFIFLPRQRQ